MTHRERMEKGMWYDANFDKELLAAREQADELCFRFNQTSPKDVQVREKILSELLPHAGANEQFLRLFIRTTVKSV